VYRSFHSSFFYLNQYYPQIYLILKSWQTFMAGLIGFGGLAWVTYRNAHFAVERDEATLFRSIEKEAKDKQASAESFATVIAWEIAFTANELVTAIKLAEQEMEHSSISFKPGKDHLKRLQNIPPARFFENSFDNISLLPAEVVGEVCEFHYEIADILHIYERVNSVNSLKEQIDRLKIVVRVGNESISVISARFPNIETLPRPFQIN